MGRYRTHGGARLLQKFGWPVDTVHWSVGWSHVKCNDSLRSLDWEPWTIVNNFAVFAV